MVWELFNHDGIVPQVYNVYKNIFENNMLSYALKSMFCEWMFQQDNDHTHISKMVTNEFIA